MTDPKPGSRRKLPWMPSSITPESLQRRLAPGCQLMAVVKADAYGHGAVPVARHLEREGIDAFAVACLEEGIILWKAGVKGTILILGYTPPQAAPELCRWQLTQTVADEEHGRALNAAGLSLPVHLALDRDAPLGHPGGGYRRPGQAVHNGELKYYRRVFSSVRIWQLAPGDEDYTQTQLSRFYAAVGWLRRNGYDPGTIHIQASGGILNLPPQPCDYARAGIALYGAAEEDSLPRSLAQNGGRVLLHGQLCPMVGRMCMDQLSVDVTDVPRISPRDIATLIGQDSGLELRVEELAPQCSTIPNELLSRLDSRLGLVVQ